MGCALRRLEDTLPSGDRRPPQARRAGFQIFNLAEVLGAEVSAEDKLVVGNSGSAIEIYLLACPTLHSQRLFHTAGLGAMGYAIPMAIAVSQLRTPEGKSSPWTGTAGFMFNIQELETIRPTEIAHQVFCAEQRWLLPRFAPRRKPTFGAATIGAEKSSGLTIPDLRKVGAAFGLGTAIIAKPGESSRRRAKSAGYGRPGGL